MNLSVRNKFLTSYLYYTTEISCSQQQICDFSTFWIMRIGFAFPNLVAPIHCQQEEERHPVICCTNGTAASYENFYCRPYKIAQHEPNKKYHIHMPSTDLIFGWKDLHGRYHAKQNTYEPKKSAHRRKRNLSSVSWRLLRTMKTEQQSIYYEVAVSPASTIIKTGITILPCSLLCYCREEVFHPLTK